MSRAICLLFAAALLGACGGSAVNPPVHHTASAATVYRQFAQCARAHGDPSFPDPVVDGRGNANLPPAAKPSVAIMQACQSILAQLPSAGRSPRNDLAALTSFAQCMRGHGITDWPDPTLSPDPDGAFLLPLSFGDPANLESSPRWPQIQAAWTGPCSQYVRASSGRIPIAIPDEGRTGGLAP